MANAPWIPLSPIGAQIQALESLRERRSGGGRGPRRSLLQALGARRARRRAAPLPAPALGPGEPVELPA